MKTISRGDYIRMFRIYCNLSQVELAKIIGVSKQTISLYETDKIHASDLKWNGFLMVFYRRACELYSDLSEYGNSVYEHIVEEVLGCDNFKWFDDHKALFDLVTSHWVDGMGPGERIYKLIKEQDSQ